MTYVLGLNAYHGDSSACLIRDGVLLAAAEEERFRRIKHWAGFPSEAIRYCLMEANIRPGDIDIVAINQDMRANLMRKLVYVLMHRPDRTLVLDRIRNRSGRVGVIDRLKEAFPDDPIHAEVREIEHHLAHMASAFLVSPFEDAFAVSVDGFGDFASAAWGIGRGGRVHVEDKILYPHSLGIFYQALTQYLGFPKYGDEYKVMGLAPYGEPQFMAEMRQIIKLRKNGTFQLNLKYFRHHREKITFEWEDGQPSFRNLYSSSLEKLLGPARASTDPLTQRHMDLAHSVQAMYEEAFFHLLNLLYVRHRIDALVLAGGCGMNSVANGKIYQYTPFKRLYVQAAPGDAGGAIGAAFVAWNEQRPEDHGGHGARRFVMDHAYWGPEYSNEQIRLLLDSKKAEIAKQSCQVSDLTDQDLLCRATAAAIADGKVVGWFQGRMEWGPRALGNRSILCDPRRANMKEILNVKIKRRESFRPFAPSILRESVSEWFETDDDVPFMTQVYPIREEKRALIPAVTHVDGTGRLQTVTHEVSAHYYALITAFRDVTGIPMVLNTSFNENEPVVCSPGEALDCFLRTRMDMLVMGSLVVQRQE